jgi:hypothetical protein
VPAASLALLVAVTILAGCRDDPAVERARSGRITIAQTDYRYAPQRVRAPAGRLTLTVVNRARLSHTLRVARGSRTLIKVSSQLPGERTTVSRRSGAATTACSAPSATTRSSACGAPWSSGERRLLVSRRHGALRHGCDGRHGHGAARARGHDRQRRLLAEPGSPAAARLLRQPARTLGTVRDTERFGVNVLAAGQEPLARLFASKTPSTRSSGKWRIASTTASRARGRARVGRLPAAGAHAGGDHTIGIGAPTAIEEGGGEPLLWHRGAYRELVAG